MIFPSAEHPAFLRIGIDVPDTWTSTQAPGAVIAAVKPAPPGEFAVNVVVSVTRFGVDHTLDTSIEALRQRVAASGESSWGEQARSDTDTAQGFAAEVSLKDPRAGTVVQGHRSVLVNRGDVRDLVHAVVSCSAAQVTDELPALRAALDSLKIDG